MISAIDTSALIAIAKGETNASALIDVLVESRKIGRVVVCEVVVAEYAALVRSREIFEKTMSAFDLVFDSIGLEASLLAGTAFHRYRSQGGPRTHLIPDFLIAAHATIQANRLIALDRGYFRQYFSELDVVGP